MFGTAKALFILSALATAQVTTQPRVNALHCFNIPESVRSPGIVGEDILIAGQPNRLFFHFVNKTGSPQIFQIVLDAPLYDSFQGVGVATQPGDAGSRAAAAFLSHNVSAEPFDVLRRSVPPGMTISGIIEGCPKENSHVICAMGTGSALPWKVSEGTLDISRNAFLGQSLIFGDDSSPIKGAYGTVHHSVFANSERRPRRVAVYFSPRGGPARLVYRYKNAVHTTALIAAKCAVLLFKDTVPALGTLDIDSVPLGGYSYPGKISVKLCE
jgi:hypothetical protein